MKILVVGDLHGDWGKLNALLVKKQPDIVLQCGDFGWWPQMEVQKPVLYGQQKPWKLEGVKLPSGCELFWCDGNHENHWNLAELIGEGKPYISQLGLYDGVFYMPRGSIFNLPDGRNVLFIGGADSVDKDQRTIGIDWYQEELITSEDLDLALSHDCRIDIVISHTCPNEWQPRDSWMKQNDPCREALSRVLEKYKPSLWYHGHWHCEASGKYGDTRWQSLDYPGHGGRWWCWLP